MDDSRKNIAAQPSLTNPMPNPTANEEHITQEMYKKNVELAERNKTLMLLRQIDEIILSSVTDPREIATKVVQLLVSEGGYQLASISLFQKKQTELVRLAVAEGISLLAARESVSKQASIIYTLPLTRSPLLLRTIKNHTLEVTEHLADVSLYQLPINELSMLQDSAHIAVCLTFPLIVRQEIIGTLLVGDSIPPNELTEFQLDLLNRLTGVIGIALDNALLYNKVQESNKKLQEIDKLKDEFVSLASHELRTPMTAIKSYLWMALAGKGGPLTEKQKYYLDRSYSSADRLIKLVNDMLNISRIESGRVTLDLAEVDIVQLVSEVIEEVAPHAQELHVQVRIKDPGTIPHVLADGNKVKEVLLNLIGNSLKFTPANGLIEVIFSVSGMVYVSVHDNGAGIAPEDLPKLFQKFGLVQGSYIVNKTVAQGTGLGLYICKSIIEMHGGTITVTSDGVAKGATFTFSLRKFDQMTLDAYRRLNPQPQQAIGLVHTQL